MAFAGKVFPLARKASQNYFKVRTYSLVWGETENVGKSTIGIG